MSNSNNNSEDYIHIRHVAKNDENYFLTIFDDNGLQTINLLNYGKNKLTFGKAFDNDIVLNCDLVDLYQGHLEINEYGVLAVNNSLSTPLIGNNNKIFDNEYLSDGNFVKIFDTKSPDSTGVLMIMSINRNPDEWKQMPIISSKINIGNDSSCDIILSPNGVDSHHCTIHRSSAYLSIRDEFSNTGTYINGIKISPSKEVKLNNFDVILVGNSKLVLVGKTLYYQIFQRGIKLEAFNIVKNVKVKFKTKQISSNISMQINPSEFVAFVGGSGAGKSTFMNCISGIDKPTSGTVLLNGEDLYENYETLKHNIGYLPQDDIVFSNLTLYDMLQYSAKIRMSDNTSKKERDSRIKEVLEIVQLTGFEDSYIRQLSGGQRKRAGIAVELLADPNLFFLDEPTSGLDPGTERNIMHTLRKISQMGKTVILVTHNPLNLHLCDKVAFFGTGGHLCFYGSPQEALNFFEVDDFVDIYNLINDNRDFWIDKFEGQKISQSSSQPYSKNNKIAQRKKSFFRQLLVLISRNVKLISNNISQLLMLFLQAPLIGFFITMVATSQLYEYYDETKTVMFVLVCASVWIGLLNTALEVCKEKVILKKEYMADLKLSAYLLSKIIVQGILSFIQAFLLVFTFQKLTGTPPSSMLISPFWDIQLICFLTTLCSSAMGLLVSCLIKNTSTIMIVIPIILIPQILFSGMLFPLEGITDFLSNFILCRWGLEGIGTTLNLNETIHIVQEINPFIQLEPEKYFIFTTGHMYRVISVILIMTLAFLISSYFTLRKNIKKV